MRAHILGAGLLLGLASTALGCPVALADTDRGTDPGTDPGTETAPFLAAPGESLVPGQELQIQGYCPDPAAGIEPGVYTASMNCSGQVLGVTFTVIEPEDPTHDLPADSVIVHPTAARPGDTLAAQASCVDTDEATLSSPVLQTVTLAPDPEGHQPWALHGSTTVSEDAEPGDYPVSAQCTGGAVETTLTVLAVPIDAAGQTNAGQTGTDQTGADGGQVSRVPRGAPETGDGARHVSVSLLALGLVVGAAAAAGAIAWREARR